MTATVKVIAPSLVPLLRYRDVAGAIEWLSEAFGFERGSVVTADSGAILYAQLTLGNAMVMLEPAAAGPEASSSEQSGSESQSCYIVVADADAHYARARAAGAEIVLDIDNFGQGGRGYSCRDGEGHVWSFGTYDPWQGEARIHSEPEPQPELQPPPPASTGRTSARWAILSGLLATIITSAVAAAWIGGSDPQIAHGTEPSLAVAPIGADELARERAAREVAERAAQDAEARAAEERSAQEESAKEAAGRAAEEAASILAGERAARAAAEKAAEQARSELSRERNAKEAAERAAGDLKTQLAQRTAGARAAAEQPPASATQEARPAERTAREAGAAELKEKLAQEQSARAAAERAKDEAQQGLERERDAAADVKEQLAKEQSAKAAAERASQDAREQINRERAAKDQAWRTVGQLRKQIARTQANASGADYAVPADPPPASSGSGSATKGDPQYNGPLSPF